MSDWFYLPFKTGEWGQTRIFHDDGMTWMGNQHSQYWMSNGPQTDFGIQGQRAMYYKAHGRVLCCLGLGILPLLLALKDNVTSVHAIDVNPDVVDAFNAQGFNTDKLTVTVTDMMDIEDVSEYDSILLDASPVQDEFVEKHGVALTGKCVILQSWEMRYQHWLGFNKSGIHSVDNYNEFAAEQYMPTMTEEEIEDYMFNYFAKRMKADRIQGEMPNIRWIDVMKAVPVPEDQHLIEQLKIIDSQRS